MKKVNIDTFVEKLEELKSLGETHIEEKGNWSNENGKVHSLETIVKEFGEDYYFD